MLLPQFRWTRQRLRPRGLLALTRLPAVIRYREEVELDVDLELDGNEHCARARRCPEAKTRAESGSASALHTLYRAAQRRHSVLSELSGLLLCPPPVLPEQGRHRRCAGLIDRDQAQLVDRAKHGQNSAVGREHQE